jgi:hypothetical protein
MCCSPIMRVPWSGSPLGTAACGHGRRKEGVRYTVAESVKLRLSQMGW